MTDLLKGRRSPHRPQPMDNDSPHPTGVAARNSVAAAPLRGIAMRRCEIANHPQFFSAEKQIALVLLDVQTANPRMARLLASYRKWLVTQTCFALSMRGRFDPGDIGLTPGRLHEVLRPHVKVNRNTLSLYMSELETYGFLHWLGQVEDARLRPATTTELAETGMRLWCQGHLRCLDLLDGGNRDAVAGADIDILFRAQPRMLELILTDHEWLNPAPSMANFLGSDVGGLLLHYLISKLTTLEAVDGRILLEPISIAALAERFLISVSNVKRMVHKAETEGLLGWEQPRRRGCLWVTTDFVKDHFRRQAVKFEMVDRALRETIAANAGG
ncbi:hypothetical protein [Thioclava pacifica]|uniref:Uncharacterized protein n=1 Tax=Thioclava pacifica DSM 10166 TaxID=1353537 RepID=A0A074JLP1_9RHOB|nr:hypothetical protein [Thioclava pacifica]KEO56503.1 hypothetical protein TP2_02955 [Thioclava pacifica DSM 10166]